MARKQKGPDPATDRNKRRRVGFSGIGTRDDLNPVAHSIRVPGRESDAHLGSSRVVVRRLSCCAPPYFSFLPFFPVFDLTTSFVVGLSKSSVRSGAVSVSAIFCLLDSI
jgi:hypothetical protein